MIELRLINKINNCAYDSPTPVMRRRNDARTTLLFFLTSGCDTHLQKYIVFSHWISFACLLMYFCVYIPTTLCRKLCDRAEGAEGPLGAAVRQSGRVAAEKIASNLMLQFDEGMGGKLAMAEY